MGRIRQDIKDPPGQLSSYIIPGDYCVEAYRIITFKAYKGAVDSIKLAKAGFYYTGYKDRTKCFRHTDKHFENFSIPLRDPTHGTVFQEHFTALLYKNSLQIGCSQIVEAWDRADVPTDVRWHKPNCTMIYGAEATNKPLTEIFITYYHHGANTLNDLANNFSQLESSNVSLPMQVSEAEESQHSEMFPCQNAIHVHMQDYNARLDTFHMGGDNEWPRNAVEATPEQIAEAGFFYLGNDDRVKCFYCNGGLQNWEYDDNPWTEHAKWFPGCEFVLRKKGIRFVRDLFVRNPDISRPTIQIHNEQIRQLLQNGWQITEQALLSQTEAKSVQQETERQQENASSVTNVNDRLHQLQTERLCKVCMEQEAGVVLMPCGHMSCCTGCSHKIVCCPVCKVNIQEKINVFRS